MTCTIVLEQQTFNWQNLPDQPIVWEKGKISSFMKIEIEEIHQLHYKNKFQAAFKEWMNILFFIISMNVSKAEWNLRVKATDNLSPA